MDHNWLRTGAANFMTTARSRLVRRGDETALTCVCLNYDVAALHHTMIRAYFWQAQGTIEMVTTLPSSPQKY